MTYRLTDKTLAPLIVGVFAAGIAIAAATGHWKTESEKVPAIIQTGEFAGAFDPADIRGSYSFADISGSFDVTVDELARAFGMAGAGDPAAILAKDLETAYGGIEDGVIGTDSLRYFVALLEGIPYTPEEDTRLPAPSIAVLRERGAADDVIEAARARSVSLAETTAERSDATPETHVAESDDTTVRGKTTFGELVDWGLSREQIEQAIGMEMGKSGVTVRDYLAEAGVEFQTARTALQALLDQ